MRRIIQLVLCSLFFYSCGALSLTPFREAEPHANNLAAHSSANNMVAPRVADPSVILDDTDEFVITGTGPDFNIPISRAKSLKEAKFQEALPERPAWGLKPMGAEIARVGDHYVMYFVSKHRLRNVNCLGVASSRGAVGPYRLEAREPLFCPKGITGVIAPNPYRDSKTGLYLLFSMFVGQRGHADKGIYIVKMSDDGLTIKGEPRKLIAVDQSWENGHIEGSTLIRKAGKYYLFYSGSYFKAKRNSYAIGYAYSDDLFGPYVKASENPILQSGKGLFNPGSQGIAEDKCGNFLFFFHAFTDRSMEGKRSSYVTRVSFVNGKPIIDKNFDYNTYSCRLAH